MAMPPWLAPTIDLAEPRFERYAKRIADFTNSKIEDFGSCVPWEHYMEDSDGNKWVEAWFYLYLSGCVFVPTCTINGWRESIHCCCEGYNEWANRTEICLSARVLR